MASMQCVKCKEGIHYHGEPAGIEYIFIKGEDWDRITNIRFDSKNKQYVNGSSFPLLYRADTIETDFKDLIMKAWKCPVCGTFMFYNEKGNVVRAYEEDDSKECGKEKNGFNHVVFDDYSWDEVTESAVANCKIPTLFNPSIHARLSDFELALVRSEDKVIKHYKRIPISIEQ